MTNEMALTTRTSLGPVRRLAMVLTVGVLAGMGSIAVAPVAAADDDETSVAVQAEVEGDEDAMDDDDKVSNDGPYSVVHRSGDNGPDAFIILEHGRKPVFFCDPAKPMKQHKNCTRPVTSSSRF